MKRKIISIILGPDDDMEAFAIRSFLEYLDFVVILRPIGRPNDLLEILQGDKITREADFLVFCFHGKSGKFIMPKLSPEIYQYAEPNVDFSHRHINQFGKLNNQCVISTGCTLGHRKLADSFLGAGAKSYIGAKDYPEGHSVLIFVTTFFYWIARGYNCREAFTNAVSIDSETMQFELFE